MKVKAAYFQKGRALMDSTLPGLSGRLQPIHSLGFALPWLHSLT